MIWFDQTKLIPLFMQLYSRTKLIAEKFLQIAVRESGCLAVNFVKQYRICKNIAFWQEPYFSTASLKLFHLANISRYCGIPFEFLMSSGGLIDEPELLIKEELREPALYNSIIEAVANGANKNNEIADRVHKPANTIAPYLKNLIALEILEKRNPVEETSAKKTIFTLDGVNIQTTAQKVKLRAHHLSGVARNVCFSPVRFFNALQICC